MQGRALKNGNSAFVDKNWNAYPDQWDVLLNRTEKLGNDEIERLMVKWQGELSQTTGIPATVTIQNRPKPWKKKDGFVKSDVVGKMHIVLGDGIYVDTLNLMPRLQNQIRSMTAFDNPIFYKNKRLGYSNYNHFSVVYMGKDVDGYIAIPRGLRDDLSVDESLILVATGQKIGQGFDYPRLDTLMLAAPVSFEGRLEQYIGRPNRDYEGKEAVIVYDYINSHIQVFDNMYAKRLRTYKRTGFELITNDVLAKQNVNAIYDSGSYMDVFEQDIVESEKRIIVSSPEITEGKVNRFLYLVKARQEAGCKVIVITTEPQNIAYGSPELC